MSISLYEHNKAAYESAVSMLEETGKAAVIHPTGTGKSFIAFKYCEDNPDKTVCWISPSEYIFKTQLENVKKAAPGFDESNIRFFTFQKLMRLSERELAEIKPSAIVYDEFHRCGAECWSLGIKNLQNMYPNVPVLGLSATNIRYLDDQRDMAQELFDGNIASEMTLGEAIVRGILAAPKYVISAFSYQNELERIEGRIRSAQSKIVRDTAQCYYEALRRALEKADGLDVIFDKHMTERTGKYIVFTSNYEAMRECMSHVSEWFGRVDSHPHVYSLYSLDHATNKSFDAFKADKDDTHLRLLFCIDALNEGVHVEDVSGVILFRPTESPIIYKQQIGRALSAEKNAKEPIIFDIINNFQGLYSIGSIEEEMRAAITYYNYFGEGGEIVNERFRIIDEVCDCKRLFDELEGALTASWDLMYKMAVKYYNERQNLDVPTHYKTPEGYALGNWLDVQRKVRAGKAEGLLGEERIAKLDAIGMRWRSVNDLSWERHYVACREYCEEYGDLRVPSDYVTKKGVRLGAWILNMRKYRRSGIKSNYFTPERERLLDELGMIWDQPDYLWNRNYSAALKYYKEHGNLEVPKGHIQDGVKLDNWLHDLRKMYRHVPGRRGELTKAQIAQMDEIGMRWKSRKDISFERGYDEAKAYYEKHGAADARFTYVSPSGFKLGVWLSKCREKYGKGKLTEDEIKRLEAINMVWSKSRKNDWDECFKAVEKYYEEHGDLNIPADYKANGVWLNKWLNEQKLIMEGKRPGKALTEEQIQKLQSVMIETGGRLEARWNRNYSKVLEYYDAHGTAKIPSGYKTSDGRDLYAWLSNQKTYYKAGKLSAKRTELLNAIGVLNAG